MSEAVQGVLEGVIEKLEQDKSVAEELLFLVLDHVGEPVVLNIAEAKKRMQVGKRIDVDFDYDNGTCTLQVVTDA